MGDKNVKQTDGTMMSAADDVSDKSDVSDKTEMPADINTPGYNERVFKLVRRIPAGRVMTYGQLAEILGAGYTARTVGFAMHAAGESVPWHRVINAQGACSTGRVVLPHDKQQRMLEAEGVEFNARGRCALGRLRWTPEEARFGEDADSVDAQQATLFDN